MVYSLALGNRAYSSWSLRAWLLFERFEIARETTWVDFGASQSTEAQLADFAPARTVPAMRTQTGAILSESLSIAEHLAEHHPETGLWPRDPHARAVARNLAAEMHAGFDELRSFCPMNLYVAYENVDVPEGVLEDVRRLERIWEAARKETRSETPWLCGEYSVADAFYAPVAARIAGYGLTVDDAAQAYVNAHLSDLAFRKWRAMAIANGKVLERYNRTYSTRLWPGPKPVATRPTEKSVSENALCPYSGDPVTHFLEMNNRIFGFCNAFCRDKTVADPQAWPAFMTLVNKSPVSSAH